MSDYARAAFILGTKSQSTQREGAASWLVLEQCTEIGLKVIL